MRLMVYSLQEGGGGGGMQGAVRLEPETGSDEREPGGPGGGPAEVGGVADARVAVVQPRKVPEDEEPSKQRGGDWQQEVKVDYAAWVHEAAEEHDAVDGARRAQRWRRASMQRRPEWPRRLGPTGRVP